MEENRYSRGKIYKIVDNTNGNIYVGSTTEPTLARRLAKHRSNFEQYINGKFHFISSFKVLENNNFEIILIENYQCNTKDELHKRERYYIDCLECVNKVIPGRTRKERDECNKDKLKQYKKEYNEINKDRVLELGKIYRMKNIDKTKEYNKEYRMKNKEKQAEYNKKYQEEHKASIKEYNKKYYELNNNKLKEYRKERYERNKEHFKEVQKKNYEKNKKEILEKKRNKIQEE
jgi:hypothetical protein